MSFSFHELTTIKHQLLNNCKWGRFRYYFRSRTPITSLDQLTQEERKSYILVLGLSPSSKPNDKLFFMINLVINHEKKMLKLCQKHFGHTMAPRMLTKIYSDTIAKEFSFSLCKESVLSKLLGMAFKTIRYKIGGKTSVRIQKDDCRYIIIRSKDNCDNHMMATIKINGTTYFIDPNGNPIDNEIVDAFSEPVTRYPTHTVNYDGNCTAWSVFFIEILLNAGPVDYTRIPKDVFTILFKNYCAHLRERSSYRYI